LVQRLVSTLNNWQKKAVVIIYVFTLIYLTFLLAHSLRFGEIFPKLFLMGSFHFNAFGIALFQIVLFYVFNFYQGIWRYSSIPDLIRIIKGVTFAVPLSFFILFLFHRVDSIPRSVFVIHWMLLILSIGGGRFAYRLYRDSYSSFAASMSKAKHRVVVIGGGGGGEQFIREVKKDPQSDLYIVGIVDNRFDKRGKFLHGVKIMGNSADLPEIVKMTKADVAVIAIPSATNEQMAKIVRACEDTGIAVKTLPRLSEIVSGAVKISKIRDVSLEDLLGREEVHINSHSLADIITDKVVMVTGAGGSIGSELCIQIARFQPRVLVCYEVSEFNTYELELKLSKLGMPGRIKYIVGDVRDEEKVDIILTKFKPQILFHAAAYKHVPIMEDNPFEAIKVNVRGTEIVARAAAKHNLERFVFISTDKAVNPTNVMGTSKRLAEMLCQEIQRTAETKYVVVRFGNVLGSSGSVIPLFKRQIEAGGPVTVTHPEITRYFMSIPEAAQLVIQAGAIGNGGEIFVLDMGKPVKIVDLAKQMITLSGFKVDEEIKIEFSGLRPGEKLYEELLADDESTLPTMHERVRVAQVREISDDFYVHLKKLYGAKNQATIRNELQKLVPEYEFRT